MLGSIIALLEKGLGIWEIKEREKRSKKLMELKEAYRDEWNKPIDSRSDAVLDNIEYELRNLIEGITTELGQSKA